MKNKRTVLWIALMVMALVLQGCSKKSEAQDKKGSSTTGDAKTATKAVVYASESDFEVDWDTNVKGGIIINKYKGVQQEVNIPPTIQNNPVTTIGSYAFVSNRYMTILTIPDSVTIIGDSAFQACMALKSVTIPDSVKIIRDHAFAECMDLTSLIISNSVTSIELAAFVSCENLTSVTIPSNVTSLGVEAFSECPKLTSVTFEGTITPANFGGKLTGPFDGDLKEKYLASDGGPGTYTRFANGEKWTKQ